METLMTDEEEALARGDLLLLTHPEPVGLREGDRVTLEHFDTLEETEAVFEGSGDIDVSNVKLTHAVEEEQRDPDRETLGHEEGLPLRD